MAIYKDLLIKGLYYAEHGATTYERWTEMMTNECGEELKAHFNYIMPFSFTMAYKRAGSNTTLKKDLRNELTKLKKMSKNTSQTT